MPALPPRGNAWEEYAWEESWEDSSEIHFTSLRLTFPSSKILLFEEINLYSDYF